MDRQTYWEAKLAWVITPGPPVAACLAGREPPKQ